MKAMLILFRDKRIKKGFTLFETMITTAIIAVVMGVVFQIVSSNAKYQKRITRQSDGDNQIRSIIWSIYRELSVSRTILYPRLTFTNKHTQKSFNNMISDSKIVVRNFDGNIVSYFYRKDTKEVLKSTSYIPVNGEPPISETKVIGKNIDICLFTNRNEANNLVGIYMESGPSIILDSVYLSNE